MCRLDYTEERLRRGAGWGKAKAGVAIEVGGKGSQKENDNRGP